MGASGALERGRTLGGNLKRFGSELGAARAKVFSSPRSLLACLSLYFSEVCFRAYVLANFLAA